MEDDYSQYNQIDMECTCCDDDDDFIVKPIKQSAFTPNTNSNDLFNSESEERDFQGKTGIIIDLSDDEDIPVKIIKADIKDNDLVIDNNFNNFNTFNDFNQNEFSGFNEIDMECNCCEDDDEDDSFGSMVPKANYTQNTLKSLFADDEEDITFENKELVDEDIIEEKKKSRKSITSGQVEDDYWDKLSKAHAKTNKKGAYNTHFHLEGDPEEALRMLNHSMGSDYSKAEASVAGLGAMDGGIGTVGSASAGGDGGVACCESMSSEYKKLYEDLLYLTGFEVLPADNGGYTIKDILSKVPEKYCHNFNDVRTSLQPYIEDTFIYPLQVKAGQNFNSCDDWCKWYTRENRERYPECEDDIQYCDLVANHWNDIYQLKESLNENVEVHKELNPKLWDANKKLLPEVKDKILEIVKAFEDQLADSNIKLTIKDIVLIGSNVNYNYDDASDLDIHIIADSKEDCNEKHLSALYNAYKSLFNKKYDISINGIETEIYVELGDKTNAHSNGIYSLFNGWLVKPDIYAIPDIDNGKLNRLVQKLSDKEFSLETNPETTSDDIDNFIGELYKLRQEAVAKEGEFALVNLAFKELRRNGVLKELKELRDELKSEELSL